MGVELSQILNPSTLNVLGVILLLVCIIYLGEKETWVWGWHYKEKVKEVDEWKLTAQAAIKSAEEQTRIIQRAVDLMERQLSELERRRPRGEQ